MLLGSSPTCHTGGTGRHQLVKCCNCPLVVLLTLPVARTQHLEQAHAHLQDTLSRGAPCAMLFPTRVAMSLVKACKPCRYPRHSYVESLDHKVGHYVHCVHRVTTQHLAEKWLTRAPGVQIPWLSQAAGIDTGNQNMSLSVFPIAPTSLASPASDNRQHTVST